MRRRRLVEPSSPGVGVEVGIEVGAEVEVGPQARTMRFWTERVRTSSSSVRWFAERIVVAEGGKLVLASLERC